MIAWALFGLAVTYLSIGTLLNLWVFAMQRAGQLEWEAGAEPTWRDWFAVLLLWPHAIWTGLRDAD